MIPIIKVLHLIDSAGLYGAEKVILSLLEELRNSEYCGILGCIRERDTEIPSIAIEAQRIGIPIVYFTMRRGFSPFGIHHISKYVRDNNIRLVHSHGYKPNIFLGVVPNRKYKILATVHGWAKEYAGVRGKVYELLDAHSLKRFDSIVSVSKAVSEDLRIRGINEKKITLIYNGIKISKYRQTYDISEIRNKYGVDDKAFMIGAVGRLTPVKGYTYLIEAMSLVIKEITNCHLFIAGEGPSRDHLESQIEKSNLQNRVKLLGYVNDIDLFLAAIDLFVMPSLTEGLPISLLEAMAASKPVLASAVGGMPEVIENTDVGVLVPPADPSALAESIIEMYRAKDWMSGVAMRGRTMVENKFSLSIMAKQYLSQYSRLLS